VLITCDEYFELLLMFNLKEYSKFIFSQIWEQVSKAENYDVECIEYQNLQRIFNFTNSQKHVNKNIISQKLMKTYSLLLWYFHSKFKEIL